MNDFFFSIDEVGPVKMVWNAILLALIGIPVGLLAQRVFIGLSRPLKLQAIPSLRQRHRKATPLTGGIGFLVTLFTCLGIYSYQLENFQTNSVLPIAAGALLMFISGLMDDRLNLSARIKMAVQIIGSGFVLFIPEVQDLIARWEPAIGYAVYPIILIWIVGVTNAINLTDGLDWLTSTICLTLFLSLTVSGSLENPSHVALAIACVFSLIPFMYYNRPVAKAFLGDNGSLTLGFLVATIALCQRPTESLWQEPLSFYALLGLPILDMGWVTYHRLKNGFSPLKADRMHLHYRLLGARFSVYKVVASLFVMNFLFQVTYFGLRQDGFIWPMLSLALGCGLATLISLMTTGLENLKNEAILKMPLGEDAVTPIRQPQQQFVLSLSPLFTDLTSEQKQKVEKVIEALFAHLKLKSPVACKLSLKRTEIVITPLVPVDSMEFKTEIQDSVHKWLWFIQHPIPLGNLPVKVIQPERAPAKAA
jgi:UDP-GlcNAc:undecaprenyl-phosphate GlcNAc-1-phosphate transferase